MKKNILLTFCFSFIPGAGQMYQGYMKKGMSLLTLLAISIALAALTNINLFIIPCVLIFAYCFFDTFQLRSTIGTENQETDKAIWENPGFSKLLGNANFTKKNATVGFALIFVGLYILINSVILNIAINYNLIFLEEIIRGFTRYLVPVALAVFSIIFGIKFITNK